MKEKLSNSELANPNESCRFVCKMFIEAISLDEKFMKILDWTFLKYVASSLSASQKAVLVKECRKFRIRNWKFVKPSGEQIINHIFSNP